MPFKDITLHFKVFITLERIVRHAFKKDIQSIKRMFLILKKYSVIISVLHVRYI